MAGDNLLTSIEQKRRGWEGWIEWRLDDGTSTCKIFGGEEVSSFSQK
jgi:hypothetical protein